jgi:hypothetical protein
MDELVTLLQDIERDDEQNPIMMVLQDDGEYMISVM